MSDLTQQQAAILEASVLGAGAVVVKAGPGSGKTHTVVALIQQHLELGVSPEEVIAITFTRRAAKELRERLGRSGRRVRASTIDSLALDVAQAVWPKTKILSPACAWGVFRVCCDMAGVKPTSSLFDAMVESRESHYTGMPYRSEWDDAATVSTLYESICASGSYSDYSAILMQATWALRGGKHKTRCRLLIVDEAQDTSLLQWKLIESLAEQTGAQLVIVGDLNQNIYSWRDAAPEVFESYVHSDDCIALPLNRSFRCSPKIVRASNLLIELNPGAQGGVVSERTGVFSPIIVSKERPALAVAGLLDQMYAPEEIAVLCRTNRTVQYVARELAELRIKANVVQSLEGSFGFLTLAALFGSDQENVVHQIMLRDSAAELGYEVMGDDADAIVSSLMQVPGGFQLVKFISQCDCQELVFGEALKEIQDVPEYRQAAAMLSERVGGFFMREAIEQLLNVPEVEQFSGAVTVSTIHQAKGLEWPAVIIADLREGVFPSNRSLKSEQGIIEERRLMYVAMTRAKDSLTLCTDPLVPSQFVFTREVYDAQENLGLGQEAIREAGW